VATDLIVLKVDKARALLAEARDAKDAKKVADLARAAEVYARRQKLSEEAIAYATAVKVDTMTLMGRLLRESPTKVSCPWALRRNKVRYTESSTSSGSALPRSRLSR
jgi:hypothetical protein